MCKDLTIGIDASRNRSGGAKAHLIGILSAGRPLDYGIQKVHVWAYRSLLEAIPTQPWLIKHDPKELEQSIVSQLWWQRFQLPQALRENGCSIVLNTDAGTVSRFRPSITMSRDMLSYEPGEIERFGFSKARLRLILLRYMQNRSLRQSDGTIFLTKYAANVIQKSSGNLSRIAYISHGVGAAFKEVGLVREWPKNNGSAIQCVYVSNTAMYKHQWMVVQAIAALRQRGYNLSLKLVGGGTGKAQQLLEAKIATSDPRKEFVEQLPFIPQKELPTILKNSNLFIFASSCENMPNTLVEAMAVGLPIACSNRGPMPEVLADGGAYFDPENADSIAMSIEQLICDINFRNRVAMRAKQLSEQYSWARCADETWAFIAETYKNVSA